MNTTAIIAPKANPALSVSGLATRILIGGLALHRSKLPAHAEEFAARLVANAPTAASRR